jgi:carboxypeptidase C (cathepsin A)
MILSVMVVSERVLFSEPDDTQTPHETEAKQHEQDLKQKARAKRKQNEKENGNGKKTGSIQPSVSTHEITIDGETVQYRAEAGTLDISLGQGEKKKQANVFYIAYTRTDVSGDGRRPLMFSFNGGPGSSSVWLHIGALGPKRVQMPDDLTHPQPPYSITSNPYSLLDTTDIVFIDPVSTGYSEAAGETDAKWFHGVRNDIRSVGRFIHQYVTRNNRWGSPKFLIGESYGTTRAAGLTLHLQERYGMDLNGVMLVSPILNFRLFSGDSDLEHVLRLPTYTATAWYNDALSEELLDRELPALLEDVEQFAEGAYAQVLMQGRTVSEEARTDVVKKLAKYTGLSEKYIRREDLRVPMRRYNKQLLREQNRVVGRFDSRFLGSEADQADDSYAHDPSYNAIYGPFTEGMYRVLRNHLNVQSNRVYEVLNRSVHPWDAGRFESMSNVDMTGRLRKAMHQSPHLKVHFASGYYDHATPYFASDYTIRHMDLSERARSNISTSYYRAGHMMYLTDDSMEKFRREIRSFVREATR